MTRSFRISAVGLVLGFVLSPRPSAAQFLPQGGPSSEQQEFAGVVLLAPEATVLGAFLGGGAAFLGARQCCTPDKDSNQVAITPVAIGAGLGAAIGSAWAVRSICDRAHPGSLRNLLIGGVAGAGAGAAVYFGGPANEKGSDQVLRAATFLFLPSLAAYAGWHMEPGGEYFLRTGPDVGWESHVGPERERPRPAVQEIRVSF